MVSSVVFLICRKLSLLQHVKTECLQRDWILMDNSIETKPDHEGKKLAALEEEIGKLRAANLNLQNSNQEIWKQVMRLWENLIPLWKAYTDGLVKETIFFKAFMLSGFRGDFIEFGSFQGNSIKSAYQAGRMILDDFLAGKYDHSFADSEKTKMDFQRSWEAMRFIAFDSFEGIPELSDIDKAYEFFPQGSYACTEDEFFANLEEAELPRDKVIAVKGFFADTLNAETRDRIELRKSSIIHIDSDLYESAKLALDFVTPTLIDGSIVIFDDYYQFFGNPELGEQRAFREWREAHPEWLISEFQKTSSSNNSFILNQRIE